VLDSIFEVMFGASLQREEREPIVFHVVYLDPQKPDPNPPPLIRENRWIFAPFAMSLSMSIPNLVKLAKATDPRTSSLVVYPDDAGELRVWGLVDQGIGHFEYQRYEDTEGAWPRPGLFHASVLGVGHIEVQAGMETLAALKGTDLLKKPIDALRAGPLREAIAPGLNALAGRTRRIALRKCGQYTSEDAEEAISTWLGTLCRLLLRIKNHGHGGAILLTMAASRSNPRHLNVKYRLDYRRVENSLFNRCVTEAVGYVYGQRLMDLLDEESDSIPAIAYSDDLVLTSERDDARDSLDGGLWFISLLSRVDGLVLMDPHLRVAAFGVEITVDQPPNAVAIALDNDASTTTAADYNHFGTRHRSMMRYCYRVPGSVGFVVSQDGDVRAMTRRDETLLFWENIQLYRW
jgi:hypothetical protein